MTVQRIRSIACRSMVLTLVLCVTRATGAAEAVRATDGGTTGGSAGATTPADSTERTPPAKSARPGAVAIEAGKASVDFNKTSMRDAVHHLQNATGITIILHPDLARANPTISLRVRDMSLGTALKWICELAGARYILVDGAIFIVPKAGPKSPPRTIVADTRDLTMPVQNFPGPQLAVGGSTDNAPAVTLTETEPSARVARISPSAKSSAVRAFSRELPQSGL